jgi:hypothetical protein
MKEAGSSTGRRQRARAGSALQSARKPARDSALQEEREGRCRKNTLPIRGSFLYRKNLLPLLPYASRVKRQPLSAEQPPLGFCTSRQRRGVVAVGRKESSR